MGLLGFLRVGVWLSSLRAFRNGFMGNILGEGFVLGGVFVIGSERQVKTVYTKEQFFNVLQNYSLCLFSDREYSWSTGRKNLVIKSTLKTSSKLPEE